MHVVFVQIYFSVGAIKYRSISETITSMEYVTMLCLQGSTRNFCYLTAGGACAFLCLDNIALAGKKMELGNFWGEVRQKLFRVKILLM